MKAEGWKFPPIRESEAMFEADIAPDWADGTVCHRCRVEFGLINRQHHCRACGQAFCSKCSSKSCVLPKFGIEKEVNNKQNIFPIFGVASIFFRLIVLMMNNTMIPRIAHAHCKKTFQIQYPTRHIRLIVNMLLTNCWYLKV